ncbi:MAG: 16S rRNA (adenine(1518)-N(6)/adenine(1519)-N(6))-dimethyltransferase RsmA [Lachnospiraceae bacterium]|nr:16S rRNA (adenine(1518)-N(6)/adenine(1519)-N(6))-dimethyltransferase RsmA [Lachnospiraceae bacterium]
MSIVDNTKNIIQKHGFTVSKRFGQNFLKDRTVLEDIVKASGIEKKDIAIEIGPGIGTLTEYLANNAKQVYAIEVDRKLIPVLEDTLSGYENVDVINADIMKVDLNEISRDRPFRIIANLPYYITTPIIMNILEADTKCRSITVMVQKEVGDRMTAGPGVKDYGALTLAVAYRAKAEVVRKVPAGCFYPAPNVDSVVVHMDIYDEKPIKAKDEELLFSLIRGAFNQRRKTLVNALSGYAGLSRSKEEIIDAVKTIGEKPTVRGEELSLLQFVHLADIFVNI